MQQPEATFVFADIAGFTALTEVHGDEAAADLAARFTSRVRTCTATHGAKLVKTDGPQLVLDPVCRMALDPQRAAGTLCHAGQTFHFCSLACIGAFARDPDSYLRDR